MTAITPNLASNAMGRADARDVAAAPAADSGPFVLNLCSSTTPMALAQTDLAELKRFTFFVSRRFEEGRERFRLHMGYFTTLAEAEEWLNVVREIYPGAWAGEAPGKKLRARAAAAAAAQAQHALGPQPRSALPNLPPAAPTAPAAPSVRAAAPVQPRPMQSIAGHAAAPVARPVEVKPTAPRAPAASSHGPFESAGITVPTVHAAVPASVPTVAPPVLAPPVVRAAPMHAAAPVAKAAPPHVGIPVAKAAPGAPMSAARPQASGLQARPASAAPAAPPSAAAAARSAPISAGAHAPSRVEAPRALAPSAAAPARQPVKGAAAPAASNTVKRPGSKPSKGSAFADSNVREVLAALDETSETGQTRMMPAPQMPRIEVDDPSLTDTQVLKYLETRREDGRNGDDAPDASISLLKPDDTGTRRALKDAVNHNAPVSFAVQLQWAVQPVELDKVPPLAIFSAYTLYTVEGSREGRKWYGLRLGFFSDAISAKQVAYYVRSEFASVAVVPVSPQEKDRATEEDNKKANPSMAFPRKTRSGPVDEFKLIDSDDQPSSVAPAGKAAAARPAAGKAAPAPALAAARSAPQPPANAKRSPPKTGAGRVGARERRGPQTLEETLEILGAGELEVDNGRGETLNDTGVRHLRVEVQKNTPFSRLLERLSERSKKN
jgi:hypothetical protein